MKDFVFKKKLMELGNSAREKVNHFFEGATNSAEEFVDKFKNMTNKTRLKVVRSVGAGIMSVLILAGFTGCLDELGNIVEQDPNGNNPSAITTVFNETTRPEELTKPQVTTKPAETTKAPDETTKKPQETTTPPVVTTTPPEETSTTPPETTTAPNEITTPREDLPADADGYRYPDFFANLVRQTILDEQLFFEIHDGVNYRNLVENKIPEIIFVERGEPTKEEGAPIILYAKYVVGMESSQNVYVRLSYKTGERDYAMLKFPHLYNSYAEYVAAVQTALENKAVLASANISELYMNQDEIDDKLGKNFAKFVGENFVDATVNCVRSYISEENKDLIRQISGFAYDEAGNSYSYTVDVKCPFEYMGSNEQLIKDIEAGTFKKTDCEEYKSTSKPVASVFEEPVNEA